jgi:hypothetical protein
MCQPVEQPPECRTVVTEDCHDDCKDVDSLVPTPVVEDVCDTVFENVCETFDRETCVPPGNPLKGVLTLNGTYVCKLVSG